MAASIGIWAEGDTNARVVLYRWKADDETGFVTFEVEKRRLRPAESGTADGVNRRLFNQVVVAILRACRRAGSVPASVHAYY